ncbi:phosphorylcholine transferase LicD [Muribaculum intestinale]|uniref:LicD family protein n=2 Tax=Muribaculum intestinale TaxID=1796646 RepID=A0A1B1S8Q6_9BACT|nr:LicD family protein [Muribaculum intestinale]ANU63181.1 LicD family protein [Muribaculum intestinale]ASB38740.1 LicD family protein [Muribaculum intestinale]PWB04325.1 LicD family protein [Muribaculum intestinale]QQR09481.1 LicD family protein [Muribaculum intestinale]
MIDYTTQLKLRQQFNPDGSPLRQLQIRLLDLLRFFDDFCNEHGIKYWLSSGTCLGAIRHGGFIPWDDDVDVEMLDEDYQKLLYEFGIHSKGNYVIQSQLNDENYIMPFAKLRDLNTVISEKFGYDKKYKYKGLFIDIFHLTKSNSYWAHRIAGIIYWRSIYCDNNLISKVKKSIFKCVYITIYPILKLIDSLKNTSILRHKLGSSYHAKREYKDIFPLKYVRFENLLLPVPNNYESYLSKIYGDYENLPDLNSIHTHITDYKVIK